MSVDRRLVSLLLVALAGVSLGVATAWMSDSGTFHYTVTAAQPDEDGADRVWICKLAGPPAEPTLVPGRNPLQVSVNSVDAQDAFSDAHPSYVVDSGEVICVEPGTEQAFDSRETTHLGSEADGSTTGVETISTETDPAEPGTDATTGDSEENPQPDE